MTPEQQAILAFLQQNADSRVNAITADDIFTQLTQQGLPIFAGRTQEQIRASIRDLVINQSSLIGSGNTGYYAIVSKQDALDAISNLQGRADTISNRAGEIEDKWNRKNPNNQI